MRRKRQQLSKEECETLLRAGTSGVLALIGEDGYPYAVPLSYEYDNGRIWFHGAKTGHKMDAIRHCCKASFCVISQDQVVPKEYTTYYKSVIAFGKIRILEEEEALNALRRLARKYYPLGTKEEEDREVQSSGLSLCMLEISIEHMTGKQAKELI